MPDVNFSDISPGAKTVHTLIILTVSFFYDIRGEKYVVKIEVFKSIFLTLKEHSLKLDTCCVSSGLVHISVVICHKFII